MSQRFNPLSGNFDLVLDQAFEISYDNTSTDLTSINVQTVVGELNTKIDAIVNPLQYRGTWNASTNTPALANTDTGKNGWLYQANVAGTVNFGAGPLTFKVGDKAVNNGTIWERWDNSDAVLQVNGQTGIVSLVTTDIPEGTNLYYTDTRFDTRLATKTTSNLAEGSNLYFTDERAQDAVGTALTNTTTVNFTYNDAGNTISAIVNDASITNVKVATGIDAAKLANGTVSNTEFQYLDGVTSAIQTQLDSKVDKVTGDITRTSFSAPISGTAANVTGAAFSNGVVRSFEMTLDAVGTSTYQCFTIKGIQRGADWTISQSSYGDTAGIAFSITTAGQIQYTSNAALTLLFKANTIGV